MARDNALRAAKQPQRLVNTLLRTKSVQGRAVLASLATDGTLDPAELEALGRSCDPLTSAGRALPARPSVAHPFAWYGYAYVTALQLGTEDDLAAARGLYRIGLETVGPDALTPRMAGAWCQLLLTAGLEDQARAALADLDVDDETRRTVTADLLHPSHGGPGGDEWLTALAEALGLAGFAPLQVEGVGAPSFDALAAEPASPRTHDDPLVTVLTSCYRPGPELIQCVRSVIAQSWQQWEMLVIDDASPDPNGAVAELLDEVEALDPRVRVIRKVVNGGTYRCRNTALAQARGELTVVIDSDDWWHPQAVELLAQPLLDNPDLLASRAQGMRLDESLRITRVGYPGRFEAAPTLMFRTGPVLARCGFFDTVRKAADTEMARRIEIAFGTEVHQVERAPLLMRYSSTSLSAADFSRGWRHEARPAYKQAYGRWHDRIRRGQADPYLDPTAPRPFPAPRRWTSDQTGARVHLDLVLGGDWRRFGGPQISMIEEIRAARAAGLRVGILHLEAIRFMSATDDPLCAPVRDLIERGEVERVFPDDDIDVDVLMVRYPPVFQFLPVVGPTFTPRHLLVMANQAPAEPDGSDQRYVPADCHANARELFGVEPRWVPQSPKIRSLLLPLVPEGSLVDWDNPGLIDVASWQVREPAPLSDAPVVGRFSRDDRIKFPSTADDLLAAYDLPTPYRIRMMGARTTVAALLRESARDPEDLPPSWTVLPHKAEPVADFVRSLDAVVYMDNADAHESFGRSLLESAATGLPVIAARKHEQTFGDVLLYADPAEVHTVLERLRNHPEHCIAHTRRALEVIRERYGHESFARRIMDLLPDRAPAAHVPRWTFHAPRSRRTPTTGTSASPWRAVVRLGRRPTVDAWEGSEEHPLPVELVPLRSDADGEHAEWVAVLGASGTFDRRQIAELTEQSLWDRRRSVPQSVDDAVALLHLRGTDLSVRTVLGVEPERSAVPGAVVLEGR